jgi:hypothetical protein
MHDRRASSLLLEGVVVVASILIAFVLDAWWDERGLQSELHQELASVTRELKENRERVVFEIDALDRHVEAGETVAELLGERGTSELVPVPDTLAWFVTLWSPTLDVSSGALNALIASGRLAQIRNDGVRLGLAGLAGQVEDAVGDELLAQVILTEQVFPAVSRDADLSTVYVIDKEYFGHERQPGRAAPTRDTFVMFPRSLEARNAILNRTSFLGSARAEMRGLLVELDNLIAMIEERSSPSPDLR